MHGQKVISLKLMANKVLQKTLVVDTNVFFVVNRNGADFSFLLFYCHIK